MENPPTISERTRRRAPSRGKVALVGAGMFVLTVALFYLVEDWRGKKAWAAYNEKLRSRGLALDWRAQIPREVRDEQNIFKAPELKGFIKGESPNALLSRLEAFHQEIEKVASNGLPVATIEIVTTPEIQATNAAELTKDLAERVARSMQRKAYGARGPHVFGAGEPAQLTLRSSKPVQKEDLQKALKGFSIDPLGSNTYRIARLGAVSARAYLEMSKPFQEELASLRKALDRPYSRMEGDYERPDRIPVPNFVAIRTLAQSLAQQAQCHLLVHEPDKALADLEFIAATSGMLVPRPDRKAITLVSAMIEVAIRGLHIAIVQDGLRLGEWNDSHLRAIQEQMKKIDLLPLVADSLKAERQAVSQIALTIPLTEVFNFESPGPGGGFSVFQLLPQGWVYRNIITYGEIMDLQIEAVESGLPWAWPEKIDGVFGPVAEGLEASSPFVFLARVAVPNSEKAVRTAARNQALAQLAIAACGLERRRLARGHYPERLEELVPDLMPSVPNDAIRGGAVRYRRTNEGNYLLYSIGWNEKDDGGTEGTDMTKGDWIWKTEP